VGKFRIRHEYEGRYKHISGRVFGGGEKKQKQRREEKSEKKVKEENCTFTEIKRLKKENFSERLEKP